jgi:hypothetical protein
MKAYNDNNQNTTSGSSSHAELALACGGSLLVLRHLNGFYQVKCTG